MYAEIEEYMKTLRKTTIREIRQTFGRFFAIFAIIALGVGFFSGVRITTPAMVHTVDTFLQDKQFFDYRLISTLGWEEEDVEALSQREDVRYAEGAYTVDVLYTNEADEELVLKTHSMPVNINGLDLVKGRLPEKENECVVDAVMHGLPEIGEHLYISDTNEEDTLGMLKGRELTVVGLVDSSYYINFERGTTSIGTGTVDGFVYVPADFFDSDVYTELFVRFDEDYEIYSKAYKRYMEERKDSWEAYTELQADARYDRLIAEAEEEIADGEQELNDKRKEGQDELNDAKRELDDGKQELDDAKSKLVDAEGELANAKKAINDNKSKLADAKSKLTDAKKQLDKSEKELDKAKKELDKGKKELDKSKVKIESGESQLAEAQTKLDEAKAEVDANDAELIIQENAFAAKEAEYNTQLAQVKEIWDMLPKEQQEAFNSAEAELEAGRAQLTAARAQINTAKKEIETNQAALNAEKKTLAEGKKEYNKGLAKYNDGVKKYKEGKKQYDKGKKEYEKGLKQYEDGVKQLASGEREYNSGLAEYRDGVAEYEDGLAEYEDGLAEYEDGVKEFDEKIADAEEEIADARKELADIDRPDTYLLERNTNIGYACFENDSEIVAQVAKVFPIFFVLVAALVCITTMGRMVEEQRTQIGVLKALGYSERAIMGKFMFYSGSAALLGCILGYGGGIILFPKVIWTTYKLMYHALPIRYIFDWRLAVFSLIAALVCSIGTTWLTCRYELAETAAGLMRPKAPKAGKRVLLEYVPAIWNHLKFLHKVSIRNIFRYKGRFFMMIVGIGGCTALLLTGFGIRDSIADFASMQYDEILTADASMTYKTGKNAEDNLTLKADKDINEAASNDSGEGRGNEAKDNALPVSLAKRMEEVTDEYLLLHEASWDLLAGDSVKEISLVVPEKADEIGHYMHFHTAAGEELEYPGSGEALISESLGKRYGISAGDEVILRDSDMRQMHVKVTGVFENHVYNYVFIAHETMETQLGEPVEYNSAYINFPEGTDVYKQSAEIAKDDNVTSITLFADVKERMAKMMSSLDYIVLVVILSAAGLAFIVLYNLTNINITERLREIATIKVLGFFRKETSSYVFRENIALTFFGVVFGLGLGVLLHRYVMKQIVVDMVNFRVQILPISFLYSVVLTFIFTFLVNAVMEAKIEKINMAESLKSVE